MMRYYLNVQFRGQRVNLCAFTWFIIFLCLINSSNSSFVLILHVPSLSFVGNARDTDDISLSLKMWQIPPPTKWEQESISRLFPKEFNGWLNSLLDTRVLQCLAVVCTKALNLHTQSDVVLHLVFFWCETFDITPLPRPSPRDEWRKLMTFSFVYLSGYKGKCKRKREVLKFGILYVIALVKDNLIYKVRED